MEPAPTVVSMRAPNSLRRPASSELERLETRVVVTVCHVVGCWPTVLLCERLMGWPDQWSRSEPLATVKYRQWLLSHGGSSLAT